MILPILLALAFGIIVGVTLAQAVAYRRRVTRRGGYISNSIETPTGYTRLPGDDRRAA